MTASQSLFVPGRIELFGKHVDYGGGPSLTCAVGLGIHAELTPLDRPFLEIEDDATGRRSRVPLRRDARTGRAHGGTYIAAVVRRMTRDFAPLKVGVRIRSTSDLPRSAGLSSSSAFITLLVIALAEVNGLRSRRVWRDYLRTPLQLAEYCGAVEMGGPYGPFPGEDGVGTRGGAQDHVAICCNQAERVSAFRYLPAEPIGSAAFPEQWTLLVGVSGVRATKTGAAQDDYNRAADQLRGLVAEWNRVTGRADLSLRGVLASGPEAAARLAGIARGLDDPDGAIARIAQFRSETERIVPEALAAFASADARALGALAVTSQQGAEVVLRNQVPETAFLARAAMAAGAHAASAFGAGFGGAVWAVADREAAEAVIARWRVSYEAAFPTQASRAQWVTMRPVAGIRWP